MNSSVVMGLMQKYYYLTLNRVDRIFDIFYWPLIGLFIWGFTSHYLRDYTGNFIIALFLGGTILWIFFQRAAQDISVYILEDFWSNNLFNLFSAPVKAADLALSIVLFGAIRAFIGFLFLIAAAFILYSFNIFSIGILAVAVFSGSLLLSGWVAGLFVSSFIFRYGQRIQVLGWSIPFLIQPFSAVYYPVDSLPIFVQKISLMLPTTYIFEGMRFAFDKGGILWGHVFTALVLNILFLVLVTFFFSRSIERAKAKGLFVKRGE